MRPTIESVVDRHGVIVCAGSGGVGKTTTAAAIGLYAARRGRRVVVLTIDPARRLADALGIGAMRADEESVVEEHGAGQLSVIMLDQKSAWDALVEHHAPSAEIRDRVLANRFYQHLSETFAGSQEYMAIEQIGALHASGRYDLIVVDTPPTRHALDFLEAPRRVVDFFDRQVIRWFVRPYFSAGWATMRFVNRTAGFVLRRLEEATGLSVLVDVSDFFTAMSGVFEGFQGRVERVFSLLQARDTAFVLIASPEEQVLSEAEYFCRKLGDLHMVLRAVVFNRTHSEFEPGRRNAGKRDLAAISRAVNDAGVAQRLFENFDRYETLARGDVVRIESFLSQLPKNVAVAQIPNFDTDLHDIAGLERMHPFFAAA